MGVDVDFCVFTWVVWAVLPDYFCAFPCRPIKQGRACARVACRECGLGTTLGLARAQHCPEWPRTGPFSGRGQCQPNGPDSSGELYTSTHLPQIVMDEHANYLEICCVS